MGCDRVSYLFGIGGVSAVIIMIKNDHQLSYFEKGYQYFLMILAGHRFVSLFFNVKNQKKKFQ